MPGTAIFDLDRTLTRQPTWMRFIWRVNRYRPAFWGGIAWLAGNGLAHKAGLLDRTQIKNRFLASLAWAGRELIESEARAFAQAEVANGLRTGARALIENHRTGGDELCLATASSDFIAVPIAEALAIDRVICTRTDWREGQAGGPRVAGINCYGEEKLRRVSQALEQGDIARPLTIYSDHVTDLDLLRLADRGLAANPSARLRHEAGLQGLSIINLDMDEVALPPVPIGKGT